ncbi:MAG: hypothetical protein ABW224_09040 [Kibdelosporangium sp.]
MGRRHKPSRWPVNWTVVGVFAVLTLAIGLTVVLLSGGEKRGGIVVPPPATQPPALIAPTQTGLEPALGSFPTTPGRPATGRTTASATILPGR